MIAPNWSLIEIFDRGYLTGTFFCVAKTAVSTPFTATDVRPPWLMALNAYSVKKKFKNNY